MALSEGHTAIIVTKLGIYKSCRKKINIVDLYYLVCHLSYTTLAAYYKILVLSRLIMSRYFSTPD